MRYLAWFIRIALLLLLLSFALSNLDSVTLHAWLGRQWQAPLIVFLLVSFLLGIVLGISALLPTLWRNRRELARLRKQQPSRTSKEASDHLTITQPLDALPEDTP